MAYKSEVVKKDGIGKRNSTVPRSCRSKSGRFFLGLSLLLLVAIAIEGCALTAVTIATVAYIKSRNHHTTARGELKAKPDKVYDAMVRVIEQKSDITIVKKDAESYMVKASKGKKYFNGKATPLGNGCTLLTVTADKELTLDALRQICSELGLRYILVKN
jgi:hypothetical protein